ncbi:MAG: dockerin type I repeat-containing protein, partial [Clostridia bacterium]|nr:dockerin type I repeat-containing protein [Clostridia bacterium]
LLTFYFKERDVINRTRRTVFIAVLCVVLTAAAALTVWAADIRGVALGDVNRDGSVDNADVILLTRYLTTQDVSFDINAADIDRSGNVDRRDLYLLQQYTAHWAVDYANIGTFVTTSPDNPGDPNHPRNVDFSGASNGYINTNGDLVGTTASTYVHSAPFSLKAGEEINIKARGYNKGGVVLAILAKEVSKNTYQAIVNSNEGTSTVEDYTYTATEDCTVVISYRADATHTAVIHDPESIDISQQIINKPHFVKREKNSVLIKSFYSGTEDIVVEIALAGGNGLPNPKNIFTVAKTSENMDSDITPSRYLLNRYTDWFSPHQVAAKENADGTDLTTQIFTGGNHRSSNKSTGGVATAECTQFDVLCDGVLVENGDSTFCETVAINITNLICGYNTWKSNGTGRKILKEQIRISMGANAKMQCEIIHTALEDVLRVRYYGLQTVNDNYATVQYLGGANRGEYTATPKDNMEISNSGNKMCRDGRFQNSTGDIMLTHIDTINLGSFDNSLATNYSYFTTTAKKSYFSLINYEAEGFEQNTGEQTCVRGWYDWVFNP